MPKDNPPRAIGRDMERLADIAQAATVDQVRMAGAVTAGIVALLTGGFLSISPFVVSMLIAWRAPTTPENLLVGVGVSAVALVATLLFVAVCTLPGAMSWMRLRTNATEVAPERRQLAARVNLWHATGGNDNIRAAMSLVHMLEEMGQGNVAQRARTILRI